MFLIDGLGGTCGLANSKKPKATTEVYWSYHVSADQKDQGASVGSACLDSSLCDLASPLLPLCSLSAGFLIQVSLAETRSRYLCLVYLR